MLSIYFINTSHIFDIIQLLHYVQHIYSQHDKIKYQLIQLIWFFSFRECARILQNSLFTTLQVHTWTRSFSHHFPLSNYYEAELVAAT